MDIAARLPKIKRVHWISGLQERAAYRDGKQPHAPARYTKPRGIELHFLFFRIIELFHVEDLSDLKQGLSRIFPRFAEQESENIFETGFDQASWRNVGTVFRASPMGFPHLSSHGVIPCLPEFIDNIRVETTHYLPSTVAISYDVFLKADLTDEMNRLQKCDYPPEIVFRSLLPWKAWRGYSLTSPARVRDQKMTDWFTNLRQQTENCIATHIRGHFGKRNPTKAPCLPTLEVFTLTGTSAYSFQKKWKQEHHQWLHTFVFPRPFSIYGNATSRYFPGQTSGKNTIPNRLLLFSKSISDEFLQTAHEESKGYTLLIAMNSLLKSIQVQLETLRRFTFTEHGTHKQFLKKMDLYEEVLRESTILERFRLEFEERKDLLSAEMMNTEKVMYHMSKDKSDSLLAHTITGLQKRSNLLNSYISQIRTTFSALVDTREIRVNLQLQRRIFWLGIVAAFAAVVGALGAWTGMKELLADGLSVQIGVPKSSSVQSSPTPCVPEDFDENGR